MDGRYLLYIADDVFIITIFMKISTHHNNPPGGRTWGDQGTMPHYWLLYVAAKHARGTSTALFEMVSGLDTKLI